MKTRIEDLLKNDRELVKLIQEEKDNSELLRMEMEAKEAKSRQQQNFYSFAKEREEADELQQESYIEEVET